MSAIIKEERIGGQRLILGDCLEVMKELGGFDAVVTDPPYGIGASQEKFYNHNNKSKRWANPRQKNYNYGDWDKLPASKQSIDLLRNKSKSQIIFGGNYFDLPPSSCWLVWNKLGSAVFADAELAWTNMNKAVRSIDYLWAGFQKKKPEQRFHQTQKPLEVMEWSIGHLPNSSQTILDPFMGSGTTLVACQRLGRNGTGIELDPEYFEIACKRVEEASRQVDLFIAPPNKQKPEPAPNLFDGDAA